MIGVKSKFSTLYEKERIKVEKKLSNALDSRKPYSLYKPAAYILESGGKRLRPLLVLFSVKAAGGKFSQAYNAAVAVELLHNFTLVHDDIMDNAEKRRGRLTLHKKYDLNTAILAGDSLLSVAYEFLLKDSGDHLKEVLDSFTHGLVEVCEGQSMDKDFELLKKVSIDQYLVMIEKKTAAMAEMCCIIGANIACGSKKEISALAGFGKNIGIAFQIQDDLLDISGNESDFGKSVGGDLVEGKKTYLFLKALEKARGKDKEQLQKVIDNKGIVQAEIPKYKALYLKLGILDDARNEIIRYSNKALSRLKYLKKQEDRDLFIWLTDSLIRRNK
ncbi:MAG: polyprenyl synthetase family protein [Ignavibacteriaceae bacterium]|nr:polyprenyl synthetase family protein [Ignavibacteriaceae bacterium]